MLLITCPWCGPREEVEFHYGGQAHVRLPRRPGAPCPTRSGRTTCSSATTRRGRSPSAGCTAPAAAAGSTPSATPSPTASTPSTASTRPGRRCHDRVPPCRPAAGSTAATAARVHLRRAAPDRAPAATRSPRRCWPTACTRPPRSIKLGRPRGIVAAWAEDPNGLVQIEEPFPEPMLLATTVELYDGLAARGIPGQGRLADDPDSARYDARHAHADVLVDRRRTRRSGGRAHRGPRGRPGRARRRAVRGRAGPCSAAPTGSTTPRRSTGSRPPPPSWPASPTSCTCSAPPPSGTTTTATCSRSSGAPTTSAPRRRRNVPAAGLADPRRHVVRRHRRARAPVVFADNDRPGDHARRRRPGPSCTATGCWPAATSSCSPPTTAPTRPRSTWPTPGPACTPSSTPAPEHRPGWPQECARRGIEVRTGQVVTGTEGVERRHRVSVGLDGRRAAARASVRPAAGQRRLEPGGAPVQPGRRQAPLRRRASARSCPARIATGVSVAGGAAGVAELGGCLHDGRRRGRAAPSRPGAPRPTRRSRPRRRRRRAAAPAIRCWRVPDPDGDAEHPVRRPAARRHRRRHRPRDRRRACARSSTSSATPPIGTAHDQGKTSGVVAAGIAAELLGRPVGELGTTTFRPPYTPVAFAALAGRDRGALFDPERVTAVHDWHVGARRGVRGRRPVEAAAVLPAARRGHGRRGAARVRRGARRRRHPRRLDAGQDRRPGPGRRRVPGPALHQPDEHPEGRLDPLRRDVRQRRHGPRRRHRAAARRRPVPGLHHHRRRGRGPGLDGGVAADRVAGPAGPPAPRSPSSGRPSRSSARAPATSSARCSPTWTSPTRPSRSWPGATPPSAGVPVRVARISFSGELAYEVNVDAWHARARVGAADRRRANRYGITPYGTETMHVLRAEKGYPIIGQDTDGTVTPHDLGMAWAVSKKKPDFVGKRSFARADNQPRRPQAAGRRCCPTTRDPVLPEGSQIVEGAGALPEPPVPMLGHVTSSYRSAALERTFALALVKAGRSRIGETVHVPRRRRPGPGRGHRTRAVRPGRSPPRWLRRWPAAPRCRTWTERLRQPARRRVQVAAEPFVAMIDVRLDPRGPAAATSPAHLGVDLPTAPSTCVDTDAVRVIWLGPDEWLVTSPVPDPGRNSRAGSGGGSRPRCRRRRVRRSAPGVADRRARPRRAGQGLLHRPAPAACSGAGAAAQTMLGSRRRGAAGSRRRRDQLSRSWSARRSPATWPTGCSTQPSSTPPSEQEIPCPPPHAWSSSEQGSSAPTSPTSSPNAAGTASPSSTRVRCR